MANFPALQPQTRSYTPGSYAVLRASTLSGGDFSVRKTNAVTDSVLSLTFLSSDTAQSSSIFDHYAIQNRFEPFDLPSSITDGGGFSFPGGYQWIYAESPKISFTPGNVKVSVILELVAPYSI